MDAKHMERITNRYVGAMFAIMRRNLVQMGRA